MVKALTVGQTAEFIKENGLMETCMGKDFTLGQMVALTKATFIMIDEKERVFINGVMVALMKASGWEANNMVKECIQIRMELQRGANGIMENALFGLID